MTLSFQVHEPTGYLFHVSSDQDVLAQNLALFLEQKSKETLSLGRRGRIAFSGGKTPEKTLSLLAKKKVSYSWNDFDFFQVDERMGSESGERSNFQMLKRSFFDPAGIESSCIHPMPAHLSDLALASRRYEEALEEKTENAFGEHVSFDLVLLGMGEDGHTASLFPHTIALSEESARVTFTPPAEGREARLTLSKTELLRARFCVVAVSGAGKKEALKKAWALDGSVEDTPIRLLLQRNEMQKTKTYWFLTEDVL